MLATKSNLGILNKIQIFSNPGIVPGSQWFIKKASSVTVWLKNFFKRDAHKWRNFSLVLIGQIDFLKFFGFLSLPIKKKIQDLKRLETSKSSEASKPQKRLKAREGFIILFPSKENVLKIIILK